MEKDLVIETNRRMFFQQYLQVLKPLVNPTLTDGELRVLGELMYYSDKYKGFDSGIRKKLLLDYDTRIEIISTLDISSNTFANALTVLRKNGFLLDREVRPSYQINPDANYSVNFKFEIK